MLVSSRGIFSSSYSFGSVIYFPSLSCSSASALSDCTFRIMVHREHYYLKTSRAFCKEVFPRHDAATNRLHDAFMSCRMDGRDGTNPALTCLLEWPTQGGYIIRHKDTVD